MPLQRASDAMRAPLCAADAATLGWASALAGLIFGLVALGHSINPDEGFYVAAARRVLAGERLYRDFFFPQMPYLPWLQAGWQALAGASLEAARAVSVLPAAASVGVVALLVRRWTGDGRAAALAVAGYAGHVLSLNYLTVVKTYGVANLAAVVAFGLLVDGKGSVTAGLAGVCAGVALGVRLPMLAVVAVLGSWLLLRQTARLPAFAFGLLVGILPALAIAADDFGAFWFGNFEFHALRRELSGWSAILAQKGRVLFRWLALPQNALLWVAAAFGLWRRSEAGLLALACAIGLGGLYLNATPTYLEYTVQLVPFLLLAGAPALLRVATNPRLAVVVSTVYAVALLVALRPAQDGTKRADKLNLWNRATVGDTVALLRSHSSPGDAVLSWWEGYPILAERVGYKGVGFWESNMGKKLDESRRRRFHILNREEVRELVARREPKLVVLPQGEWQHLAAALAGGYDALEHDGPVLVYRRRAETVMP